MGVNIKFEQNSSRKMKCENSIMNDFQLALEITRVQKRKYLNSFKKKDNIYFFTSLENLSNVYNTTQNISLFPTSLRRKVRFFFF